MAAAPKLGSDLVRKQRWLTALVVGGISLTALAVGLTYWRRINRQAAPARLPPSPAVGVNQQVSGYTFTHSEQNRPVFTIRAARTVSYQGNKSTVLEDVTVEMFGRKGDRDDKLRTEQCQYDALSGDFLAGGPVHIELNARSSNLPGTGTRGKQRVFLDTSKVAFHQGDQVAETDQPVQFHVGPATGSARGLNYAIRDGWLQLKHDVVVNLRQGTDRAPQPPIHLVAAGLRYDKDGGLVMLAGPVEVSQGNRRAVSDKALIELDDNNRVSQLNLEGDVRAYDTSALRAFELSAARVQGDFDAASGQLRHLTAEKEIVGESREKGSVSRLTAQRVDMDFFGKHPQPLRGAAKGNVHISVESQPVVKVAGGTATNKGSEKKTLTAEQVTFDFRPNSTSLKDAQTEGPGTLTVIPADPKAGEKVITAGQFLMAFDARSQMESLRGTAPTQVLFRPAATAQGESAPQISQADRLDAVFDAATQNLREVRQSGNFHYRDGDRQASAADARFDVQTQILELLGHPQIWDPESRVRAKKITIDTRTNTSEGEGNVQASEIRNSQPGTPPSSSMLPTNVLADRMVVEQQSQTVHFQGHVRAWQGADMVESTALDVNRREKRVSSGTHVTTSFLQSAVRVTGQGGISKSNRDAGPVTVQADSLKYFDQGRRARYEGNVRMVTQNVTLRSDRLDVYLTQGDTAEGSQVDHAIADGHVKVTQPGRMGSGDHAEYFAGPQKIILSGGPPVLLDEAKGSTTGQRLTFFIHDDRLFVDGGDISPSLSRHRVAP